MARPDKVAKVDEVADRLGQATATVLTEYSGLSVSDLAELRRRLRESDAEYAIVKNTLTRLATRKAGVEIPDDLLTGPTAITFCAGDPVAAAKVLKTFARQHPGLVIKGGVVEGSLLDAEETSRLADLETREELLSKLAGLFGATLAQPARLARANLEKAARLFAALQEKKPAEAAPAEAAAPEGGAEAETAEDATEESEPQMAEAQTTDAAAGDEGQEE